MAYDGRTLTYHLNRLADTLVGDIPQFDAQGAANIWAGTAGLDLHGALNAKAGTTGLGVGSTLNLIAGTDNLDPLAAITDYTSIHPYFAAQLVDTPIAQWRMDETTGTTMVDSSGNGHDGIYVGGLSLASTVGEFTAPHFVNDWTKHARVTNGAWMNAVDGAITLEALYYADTFNTYATIIGGDDMGVSSRRATMRWDSGPAGCNWSIGTNVNLYTLSGPAGVTGALYHGAMTYNGSVIKNYINGVEVNSVSASGNLNDWVPDVYIGRTAYTPTPYGAWNGYLCGIAWYETALSAGRILAHAEAAGLA